MESFSLCLSFSVFLCCSASAFDGALGSTASCHTTCRMTYSLHTYPREAELFACQRGCRLFSICQFVGDTEHLNQTKSECDSACNEAYDGADERFACGLGCQGQLPFAQHRQEQLLAMMPRIHLLYPLTLVRGFWEDMMNQAHEFITSSWTFYLQADDGKVVVFQTGPQVQFVSQFDLQGEELKKEPQSSDFEMNEPVYSEYSRSSFQERLDVMDHDQIFSQDDYNFLGCLSRSPWLPGWILITTLLLSVLVLIWICCATLATAADQFVPAEKLSIYGDQEYMNEKNLKPYPQSSLLIVSSLVKEDEAEALPSKLNMDLTKV
ncbi:transmembrane protein 59 [Tachysurus fulvidraco]|uniref:transmembrane protein 59 n=1 Tax=Tachysurus fulvidraco TaxID=1234273 RepID=UPI000F50A7C2|nr:transmembrane protein 59 [Tachysurus fulvidraco]